MTWLLVALIGLVAGVVSGLFGVGGADRLVAEGADRPVSSDEAAVLHAVEDGADAGSIAALTSLDPARVRMILGTLEAAGLVRRSGIGSYERAAAR